MSALRYAVSPRLATFVSLAAAMPSTGQGAEKMKRLSFLRITCLTVALTIAGVLACTSRAAPPGTPQPLLDVADVRVAPQFFDFGVLRSGDEPRSRPFHITNVSGRMLFLDGIGFSFSNAFAFGIRNISYPGCDVDFYPGETCWFDAVAFWTGFPVGEFRWGLLRVNGYRDCICVDVAHSWEVRVPAVLSTR